MKYLTGTDFDQALKWIEKAAAVAVNSTCQRSRCGSVIVKDEQIIWTWFNSPALDLESQRRCGCRKSEYDSKITDKTCCIHAEQRAIMDALKTNADKLDWSRLYFIRLDNDWKISYAGQPYCTICSKMSLDAGISEFVLYHQEWICVYDTQEYNELSYKFNS